MLGPRMLAFEHWVMMYSLTPYLHELFYHEWIHSISCQAHIIFVINHKFEIQIWGPHDVWVYNHVGIFTILNILCLKFCPQWFPPLSVFSAFSLLMMTTSATWRSTIHLTSVKNGCRQKCESSSSLFCFLAPKSQFVYNLKSASAVDTFHFYFLIYFSPVWDALHLHNEEGMKKGGKNGASYSFGRSQPIKVELGCLSTQTQVTLCILLLFSIFVLIVGEGIIKLVFCEALCFVVWGLLTDSLGVLRTVETWKAVQY